MAYTDYQLKLAFRQLFNAAGFSAADAETAAAQVVDNLATNVVASGYVQAGTNASVGTSLVVGTNITQTAGNHVITAGNSTLTAGNLTLTSGNATLTSGNLTLTSGNAAVTTGDVAVTTGNVLVTTGNVAVTTGNLNAGGNLLLTSANCNAVVQSIRIQHTSYSRTLTADGATNTITSAIPAGSFVLGVSAFVTTEIQGCTSVEFGDGTDPDGYGVLSTLTAGATKVWGGVLSGTFHAAATDIVLTATGGAGDFSAGVVNVKVSYIQAVTPTS